MRIRLFLAILSLLGLTYLVGYQRAENKAAEATKTRIFEIYGAGDTGEEMNNLINPKN